MEVFKIGESSKPVLVWGPIASLSMKVDGVEGMVSNDWILVGMQVGAKEIADVRQCFNDVSYIYALGNDQGRCGISLSFMVFIGTKNCNGTDNMKTIKHGMEYYKDNRISRKTSASNISIGGFSTKGWLVGIDIGQADAEHGTCQGMLSFIMQLEA